MTRVDNRLIHGQVLEVWLPHLRVQRVAVADDEASTNALMRAALSMAVPDDLEVVLTPLAKTDFARLASDPVPTLLLVRDIAALEPAAEMGLPPGALNVGNVHASPARKQISRSVYLSEAEIASLHRLSLRGFTISVQAVPTDPPHPWEAGLL